MLHRDFSLGVCTIQRQAVTFAPILHYERMGVMPMNDINVTLLLLIVLVILLMQIKK